MLLKRTARHGELEPDTLEPKPDWQSVPRSLIAQIESAMGSPVREAEVTWGGYTPSATFSIQFENGSHAFCKATHSGNTEWGARAFEDEIRVFKKYQALSRFSPRFFADVQSESWKAMLFEFIEDRESTPPWTDNKIDQLVQKIVSLHSLDVHLFPELPHAFDSALLGHGLFNADEGWASMAQDSEAREGFCALYENTERARKWLNRNIDRLAEIERNTKTIGWTTGIVHQDLRSDNMLFSKSRGLLFVDWPYLAVGPLAMDFSFLLPSIHGENGPAPQTMLAKYQASSRKTFSNQELMTAAVLTAGYFANGAQQMPVAALPKLKWVQRLQAFPAIEWMCAQLSLSAIDSKPKTQF